MLVVMTGLPGTGKSAVAEAVAKALRAPVFSVDPLEAVLLRAGIDREQRSDTAAYDLAAALATSQLQLGQISSRRRRECAGATPR
jgi:predicted kinase